MRILLDSCHAQERRGDFAAASASSNKALRLARTQGDPEILGQALLEHGRQLHRTADFNGALTSYLDALRTFEAAGDLDGQAEALNNIGTIHHTDKDYTKAADHYRRSLAIRRRQGDLAKLALAYNNMGTLNEDAGDADSALYYHRLNLGLRAALGDSSWMAVAYSHLGTTHARAGRTDSALHYLRLAYDLSRTYGSKHTRTITARLLGSTMLDAGNPTEGLRLCQEALGMARTMDDPYMMQECYGCIHQADERLGRHAEAYTALARFTALRDSLFGQERTKERTRIEMQHEFERQALTDSIARMERQRVADLAYQAGLNSERSQKRFFVFLAIAVVLLAVGLWTRLAYMRRSRNMVQRERERSDRLLLNILPAPIAAELRESGHAKARYVEGVSILFTDFHDFTRWCERLDAHELVGEIDACFKAFDAICAGHGLEKIKTIGDAYMAAGGLPETRAGSTLDTVRAALAMQSWLERRAAERRGQGLPAFRMRTGIHTGAVVAGIVGDSKFQYDVWGDAVNTAARIESTGEVGRVNISEATWALVNRAPGLAFTARGHVAVKGKGTLNMYFVDAVPQAEGVQGAAAGAQG